jgi:deoxyribodipyrimidine photolyase-related protein
MSERKILLVFPHQLFLEIESLSKDFEIFLIEDSLFFGDFKYFLRFHKQKLVLHRAAMKSFAQRLMSKGFLVDYIEYQSKIDYCDFFLNCGDCEFFVYDPVDFILEKRLLESAAKVGRELKIWESPNFLTDKSTIDGFFDGKKKMLMSQFYIFQRKRLGVLIDGDKPLGGKWSFDFANRKKLPKGVSIPVMPRFKHCEFVKEAISYVEQNFPNNPGNAENFNWPIDHEQAQIWLQDFLGKRFENFGPYEDAISQNEDFLFHSLLSASLNVGLLSPREILKKVLAQKNVPIESLEGFVRQIIGWREFMRCAYLRNGVQMRTRNFLSHLQKLSSKWYCAETGVLPVDNVIKKVLRNSYCHHIERLMVLGNFMLLSEIHPDEVYRWFMELFIDAYDWVMVPNVYAMSQFADGGTITTKPYFSSSNYILKMSDYKKDEWCETWDKAFWEFVARNRELLVKNPRLVFLVRALDKKLI